MRRRPLPGDELVAHPTLEATRTITIRAHPGDIWPWLARVGMNRAGWYSYDWLDNLGRASAREIIPELLDIRVDVMPLSPDGKHGIPVHALDPPHSMVWGTPGDTSWAWVLDPRDDGSKRVITRIRSRYRWLSPTIAFSMLLEFADIWMIRRMLSNLQERVEATTGVNDNAAPPRADMHVARAIDATIGARAGESGRLAPCAVDGPLTVGARGGPDSIRTPVTADGRSRAPCALQPP